MVGPDRFYTIAHTNAAATILIINVMLDCLLLLDVQNWRTKPNVSYATGIITKLKSANMIIHLCLIGSFRLLHRMTPSFVVLSAILGIMQFSWQKVANPCVAFLFGVIQKFTPFEWTYLLGAFHHTFFPTEFQVNHVMNAFRGVASMPVDAASTDDGVFFFVISTMIVMLVVMFCFLDGENERVQKMMYNNACSALLHPYRPHVLSATLVWVIFKLLLLLGRPLLLFSGNICSGEATTWPHVVLAILFYDTVLNGLWLLQMAIGTMAPFMNHKLEFSYYTAEYICPAKTSVSDDKNKQLIVIKIRHVTNFWSTILEAENSINCVSRSTMTHDEKNLQQMLILTTLPGFDISTSSEAHLCHKDGSSCLSVGDDAHRKIQLESEKDSANAAKRDERMSIIRASRATECPVPATPFFAAATPPAATPPAATLIVPRAAIDRKKLWQKPVRLVEIIWQIISTVLCSIVCMVVCACVYITRKQTPPTSLPTTPATGAPIPTGTATATAVCSAPRAVFTPSPGSYSPDSLYARTRHTHKWNYDVDLPPLST